MDPLSVAAGVAGLVALAGKLGHGLQDSITKVQKSDSTLRIFSSELGSLTNALTATETVLKRSNLQDAFERVASSEQAAAQLSSLNAIIVDCRAALEELEALLSAINGDRLSGGILRKPVAAWKLSSSSQEMGSIQRLIKTYNGAIQVHLLLLNLLVTTDTTPAIQNIDRSLADIRTEILRLRFSSQNTIAPTHPVEAENLRRSLRSSEAVLSSASEYLGSTAGTIEDNITVEDYSASGELVASWLQRDYEEDLDASLISNLAFIAEEHYDRGEFPDAIRYFAKIIEKAEASGHTSELIEVQFKLASAYKAMKEYSAAEKTLDSINLLRCTPEQTLELQQDLATVKLYANSDLDQAKIYARDAVKGRSKFSDRRAYFECVDLLATICEEVGEVEEAAAYRRLLPDGFKRTIGTSRSEEEQAEQASSQLSSRNIVPVALPATRDVSPGQSYTDVNFGLPPPNPHVHRWPSGDIAFFDLHVISFTFMAFSPDGTRLFSGSSDATVRLWDIPTQQIEKIWYEDKITAAVYSPEGSKLAAAVLENIIVWDASSFKQLALFTHRYTTLGSKKQLGVVSLLAFSRNGSRLVAQCDNGSKTLVWDIQSGKIVNRLNTSASSQSIHFSPSFMLKGQRVSSVFGYNVTTIMRSGLISDWRLGSSFWVWAPVFERSTRARKLLCTDLSPNGKRLLVCSQSDGCYVQDLEWKKEPVPIPCSGVWFGKFSSDGRRIIVGTNDGSLIGITNPPPTNRFEIWDIRSRTKLIRVYLDRKCECAALSSNGRHLAYSMGGSLHVVDVSQWMGSK